jgi:hypothetical protein
MYLFAENSLLFLTLFFFIIILNFVFMKLILEIQLSGGRSWDHINRFYLPTFLCLSQARTWISNGICCGLYFCLFEVEVVVRLVDIGEIIHLITV